MIEVDAETAAIINRRAAAGGVTVAELIATLVGARDECDHDARLNQQWAEIESDAPTIPHEDVVHWLETWGTPRFQTWSKSL